MEAKQTNSRKKGGLIAAICAAVALIVAIILLLTQCGGLGIKTVSGEELAKNLREPGDSVITLNDNVVITEPITVVGNKTIVGSGSIILDAALEGQWPETSAPGWGVGCAKLEALDTAYMSAAICVEEGASLTLGGNTVVYANGNGNGIALSAGSTLTLQENATVKNGRYANLIVAEGSTANLSGGKLLDGGAHNVINHGTVKLSGTEVSGALAGAAIYSTGAVEQTGGTVAQSTGHNVYVVAGTYTMTGGTNIGAKKDGLLVAQGATANVTGGTISECNHGLCNNGTMTAGEVELNECGIMNYATGELTLSKTVVDTAAAYCLANNGGKVSATDIVLMYCDTVAVYNFSGDMVLTNPTVTEGLDGNVAVAGGNLTVEGGTLGVCRDKSISVGGGVAVFNNVSIEGTKREKYGVYSYGGELYLNNCSIENVSSTAVKVDAGGTVELTDVSIKDAEQSGFQLDGGMIIATRVSMENLGSHGVYNNGGELKATDLTIVNTDKNAIQNKDGNAIIKNLKAKTMGNHGAYVEAGTLTIESGSVSDAVANGFYLPAGEGKLVLKDVTISNAGQQGINNSAKVAVTNVTITGTQMNGIYNKAGGSMTVNGAKIYDVAEHGISNKSTMIASNVTILNTGAGSNGIQNNGTMVLSKASISTSKNHGLYNTGSLNATDVTINGTAQNGVYNDDKGNVRITTLEVTNTGEHGINNKAVLTAEKVQISSTGKDKNGVQNSGTLVLVDCAITKSQNHGIYNTGSLQANGLEITDVAKNGIYNSKGKVTGITDLVIMNVGDQGINNTGEFTAQGITISGTAKNGVYTNGGVTTVTGLTVTKPGEHGVSNDFGGVVTLTDATLDGSGKGSNCIQNKATMTLQGVTVKNSSNHGIYNDSQLTSTGALVITGAAVNGIYNYGGTVELAKANISATGEHGVNNAGTMTAGMLTIDGVAANGIQNSKDLTITEGAVITASGKHGIYNGKELEAANVTVTGAGDLLLSNSGDMVIKTLKLSGAAQKAIYNAGYAELYTVTVDGSQVRNKTDATAQYLVDNNGGVLDLTDATIHDAWGTALHIRGSAAAAVTNVIIDGAGNYGTFVAGGSKLTGDGLVINNVAKNTEVSGAEGIGLKNQGKVTMMDHLTIGAYDANLTGDGVTALKETSGIANNNALVLDAATATFSGYNLTICNTPNGCAIYNKGTLYATDLHTNSVKDGVVCRYDGWATLSGQVEIKNSTRNPVSVYGAEGKTYKNGVTLTEGTTLTIDTAGSHAINNKGSFLASNNTVITIKNIAGQNINAINNNGGTMVLDDVYVDGLYVTISKNGDTINTNAGNALQTNNKLTLNGEVTVQNTFYKAEGGLKENSNGSGLVVKGSGVVDGTGSLTIIGSQTAPAGYEGYTGLYNGIYDEKRNITLKGDVTISGASNRGIELTTGTIDVGNLSITDIGKRGVNIYGNGKLYAKSLYIDNTVENGIQNNPGTIEIAGAAVIKNATATGGAHGIYNNGTFKAGSLEVSNVTKNGINNAATMNITGLLKVKNAVAAGVANTNTVTAGSVQIDTVTAGNGIHNNNVFTVSGDITVSNVSGRGINNYGSGNLSAVNITIDTFGESGIQNAATLTATGNIVIKNNTTRGHGIYNTKNLTAGSLTIQDIIRKGLSNDGGTVNISGDLTVDTVREEGILNNGTITVSGFTTVKNVTGTAINPVHNKSGKTLSLLGGGLITDVKVVVGVDADNKENANMGNGIYTEGNVVLGGTTTITNLFTDKKNNSLCAGVIANNGGKVTGAGNLVITGSASTDSTYPYGINNGIFLDGKNNNPTIDLTGDITITNVLNQGIYLANEASGTTAKLTARNITVTNVAGNGVYNRAATNELTATGTITVKNAKGHGISNGGKLTAGAICVENTTKNGVENTGTVTVTGTLEAKNIPTGYGIHSNAGTVQATTMVVDTVSANIGIFLEGSATLRSNDLTVKNIPTGYGIHSKGGTVQATTMVVDTVSANIGIFLEGSATLRSNDLTVKNVKSQGIQANHANTIEVQVMTLDTITKNGLRLYNNSGNPTVTIGTVVATNCTEYALAAQKALTSDNLTIGTLYWVNCGKGAAHGNIKSGIGQTINELPAEAVASAVEEN